jgi:hypothetical protein
MYFQGRSGLWAPSCGGHRDQERSGLDPRVSDIRGSAGVTGVAPLLPDVYVDLPLHVDMSVSVPAPMDRASPASPFRERDGESGKRKSETRMRPSGGNKPGMGRNSANEATNGEAQGARLRSWYR